MFHRLNPLRRTIAIRSFTTESTEGTEAGRKGVRIRIRTRLSFPSVSANSVLSVVKIPEHIFRSTAPSPLLD